MNVYKHSRLLGHAIGTVMSHAILAPFSGFHLMKNAEDKILHPTIPTAGTKAVVI